MIRYNRRNNIWLVALSALMILLMLSSNIDASVQAFFAGLYLLAVTATFIDFNALSTKTDLMGSLRAPLTRNRMSPEAREAVSRASARTAYSTNRIQLVDIGVITAQTSNDGMVMRRTRSISKDDDGVRPFVELNVPTSEADRRVRVLFEIIDQNGQEQFIYEMPVYLRDGEMNVFPDTQIPLAGNDMIAGMGDWDLRVSIDGQLVGIHTFALTASQETRVRRLQQSRRNAGEYYVSGREGNTRSTDDRDKDDSGSMSLEELLRNENQRNQR